MQYGESHEGSFFGGGIKTVLNASQLSPIKSSRQCRSCLGKHIFLCGSRNELDVWYSSGGFLALVVGLASFRAARIQAGNKVRDPLVVEETAKVLLARKSKWPDLGKISHTGYESWSYSLEVNDLGPGIKLDDIVHNPSSRIDS